MANPRDFAYDPHHKVDDRPFGGSAGMLMQPEPVALALETLQADGVAVVFPDPTGEPFVQRHAQELAEGSGVTWVCGHYEGIDERVRGRFATHTLSLGDFVLTGGELPALVMADAVLRLRPGVIGSSESLEQDSYADGLLSAPQFTRPEVWRGEPVPEVLRSGDHGRIARWRRAWQLMETRKRRPDLFAKAQLTPDDLRLLEEE